MDSGLNVARTGGDQSPLLEVHDLVKTYRSPGAPVAMRAVDGISFSLAAGETLGLVGESGSGKTTVARCIVNLTDPSAGRVVLNGADVTHVSARRRRTGDKRIQYVFQDPYDSLNPRWQIRHIVEEPLITEGGLAKSERRARVAELMRQVNLDDTFLHRYPRELSGGQRQRVGIARALAARPALVVLDEPTSALDSLTRKDILQLLLRLKRDLHTAFLFISHDLSAVRHVCDRIAVMYLGEIVEMAPTDTLFASPKHPYTRSLLSSILDPRVDGRRQRTRLVGDPPSTLDVRAGCRLNPRCPIAEPGCASIVQTLDPIGDGHTVRCMVVRRRHLAEAEPLLPTGEREP